MRVNVLVLEAATEVECDPSLPVSWLLSEVIRVNEDLHRKLRFGLTGLRHLGDAFDLDLAQDMGELLQDGDTVEARTIPPDWTSVQVVLGDVSKELLLPRTKTVEAVAFEATKVFGGLCECLCTCFPRERTHLAHA